MYHLDQLTALCKAYPLRTKVVFVPSQQVGYNVSNALAYRGVPWVNLRMTTLSEWVRSLVVPQLEADGWKPLLPNYDLFFIDEMVNEGLKDSIYFGRSAGELGLGRVFLDTCKELRAAGVKLDDLTRFRDDHAKFGELAAIYQQYIEAIQRERFYDDTTVYEQALERETEQGDDRPVYAIFDEVQLSGLAVQYVKKIVGKDLFRIGRDGYSRPIPQTSAAYFFATLPRPSIEEGRMGWGGRLLMAGKKEEDEGALVLVQTLGDEEEVRHIFRDLLARGVNLDTVEIAYSSDQPYLWRIYNLVQRYELPATFAGGLPPELTRVGQSLLGFVRWVATGFDVEELIGLCQAGLIGFCRAAPEEEQIPRSQETATLLRGMRIRQGREGYKQAFARLGRIIERRIESFKQEERDTTRLETQLDRLRVVQRLVDGLFALLPEGRQVLLADLTQAGLAYLELYAPISEEMYEKSARTGLTVHLRNIGDHVDSKGSLAGLATYLLELIVQHRVESVGARHGHLFIVPLERAGYTHRAHLYVIGLDEGAFPGRGIEDAVLLDAERAKVSQILPLRRLRPGERVWQLEHLLGMSGAQITLVARRRSMADGSECYPSAIFQQLNQLVYGKAEGGTMKSLVPDAPQRALDRIEMLLAQRRTVGFVEHVAGAYPGLVQGRQVADMRTQRRLSRFEGWLGETTPELNPANGELLLSVSRLEALVQCPYRYFLKYVLHIEPPEEFEEDTSRWLTPMEMGSLLHDIFCEFMEDLQEAGEKPGPQHAAAIRAKSQEKVEAQKEKVPVEHEAAYRADLERLEQAVDVFLRSESQRTHMEAVGFEVSFGFGKTGDLNSPEPVLVTLSERIKILLRGYIDRVDRDGDNYYIWDYKTGSSYGYKEDGLAQFGTYLQWALYAFALEQILQTTGSEGRVVRSGYFFTRGSEYGQRVAPTLPGPKEMGQLLDPLFQLVEEGSFFHVQKEEHCKYCDFHRLCASERIIPKEIKDWSAESVDNVRHFQLISEWLNG